MNSQNAMHSLAEMIHQWLRFFITRFLLLHLRLVRLPDHSQIELASRARRHATEDPCVSGKREWNLSQVIYPHPGGNGYCRNLSDLDSPLANNVAAQDFVGRAVGDQLAETGRPTVDYRARGRVEMRYRCHHIVSFARLRFSQPDLRIFRVGEAADRTHLVSKRHRWASNGVGGRNKTVLYRLWDQHQTTSDVPGGEDRRRRYVAQRFGGNRRSA